MSKEKIDISNLPEKLKTLSGIDFEEAEKDEITAGNKALDVTLTRSYAIRIAAKALNVKPLELKKLPVLEYLAVVRQVNNFLVSGLELDKTLFTALDNLPSDFATSEA